MRGSLDRELQHAVHEIEMVFETKMWRKRIVDARPARQFARQKLAVEPERGRRDRPAAEAGRRVDPFRLVALPDQRWRVVLDIGKQAGDRGAVRAGERDARLTPLNPASSSSDQLRARRNARSRSASRRPAPPDSVSVSISGIIFSIMRESRRGIRRRIKVFP